MKRKWERKPNAFWRAVAVCAALLLLALCLAACGKTNAEPSQEEPSSEAPAQVFASGTVVGGVDISAKSLDEALALCKDALKKKVESLTVTLKNEHGEAVFTGKDIEYTESLRAQLVSLLPEEVGATHTVSFLIKPGQLPNKLEASRKQFEVEEKDAALKGFDTESGEFVFEKAVDGETMDVDATLKALEEQFEKGGGTVAPVMNKTPAKVTEDELKKQFVMLSEYSTVSTNTENGNHNMTLALEHVNGTILQPGDTFSYEKTIGNSSIPDEGYLPAGGLTGGALVQMYGGGICQASSTLYVAAMQAGMTVVARYEHSQPSTYLPIGLDAMVSYGDFDFQFKNELSCPVYIKSWMEDVTLHVQFYGTKQEDWDSIVAYSETTGTFEPLDTVDTVVDRNLDKGDVVLSTSGNWGYSAKAWREYIKDGKVVKTEDLPSSYYGPTGKIYRVGLGTDTSSLTEDKPKATKKPQATKKPKPTEEPTPKPTKEPKPTKAPKPTEEPTAAPTAEPTEAPTPEPTAEPTAEPTEEPTPEPPVESEPESETEPETPVEPEPEPESDPAPQSDPAEDTEPAE